MASAAEQGWLRERGLDEALQFALERLLAQFREANPGDMRRARRAAARRAGQPLTGGAEGEEEEEEEETAAAAAEEEEKQDEEEEEEDDEDEGTGAKRKSAAVSRAALRSVAESLVLFQSTRNRAGAASGPAP